MHFLDAINRSANLRAYISSDFSGGMRRSVEPYKLSDTEYALLKNGRNRYGVIRPVKEPVAYTANDIPNGNYQGIHGVGSKLFVFINGKCFTRDFGNATSSFAIINDFTLDAAVDTIYTENVPATRTPSFKRVLKDPTDIGAGVKIDTITGIMTSIPQCIVCQDGLNQPQIIINGANARTTKTFAQWSMVPDSASGEDQREYVPIGKQMAHVGGKLYIMSPNGIELFHSVTGRPLDFVIAIDAITGNKLPPTIAEEARRTSQPIDFEPVTCLGKLGTDDESFFVSTGRSSYIVIPNRSDTIYGEPKFVIIPLFPTGALNQFSFLADILGDSALVDNAGIRSFNAVLQIKNEGKNAPFSADVFPFFDKIVQDISCVINFDNYALFAVNTVYGYVVLVFDTLTNKFVAYDQYAALEGAGIKQFAEVVVDKKRRLFFITTDNRLFEAFADAGATATCEVYFKESHNGAENPLSELLPKFANIVFTSIKERGTLTATEYVDGQAQTTRTRTVETTGNLVAPPLDFPFGTSTEDDSESIFIPFQESKLGFKIGLHVTFDFNADLGVVALGAEPKFNTVTAQQKAKTFNNSNPRGL